MIRPNPQIESLAPYALANLSAPPGKRLMSLAQNESAFPPSPRALVAAQEALSSSQLYPDPDWQILRRVVADVHNIPAENVLCGAGSMELIACLTQCYCGPGDRVLSSQYGYAFFRTASLAAGASYDAALEVDFTLSVDALLAEMHPETKIVFVANPGNPTGTRVGRAELVQLRKALPADVLLVIDEAYGEFADTPGEGLFDLVAQGATVVLRTLSKAYGLAGMRVGWGLFPPEIAVQVRKVLNPNNISTASQAAATAAFEDQDYMQGVCRTTAARRDRFREVVLGLGLRAPESFTNFLLIGFDDKDAAGRADAMLRAEGILMRGMAGYGLPHCLRATVGGDAEMQEAADILTTWRERETKQ